MARWVAALGLVAACGAACGGLPALPSKGGPAWHELASDHFIVWTDVEVGDARRLVRELEEFRRALVSFALRSFADPLGGRSLVIVVRDWDEWQAFSPGTHIGGLTLRAHNTPLYQPILLFPREAPRNYSTTVLHHELGHLVLHQFIKVQPTWFAEGMATYLETITIDPVSREVVVGKAPGDMYKRLVVAGGMSIDRALDETRDVPALYNTAYFMVSYLFSERHDEFATYQRVLKQVFSRAEQRAAWVRVFPELNGDKADQAIVEYFQHGHAVIARFHLPLLADLAASERTLGDAEALTARALLYVTLGGSKSAAIGAVDAALRLAPDAPLASALSFALGKPRDAAAMRAVVAAHPDDWLALLMLARALGSGPEATDALQRACALAAQNRTVDLPEDLCEPAP